MPRWQPLVVVSLLCGPAHAVGPVFSDQTAAAGLQAVHSPSSWLSFSPLNVGSFLGGGAIGDFNRDGHQDVFFLTGGGGPDRLFINDGDGTFTDRAVEWGVAYAHMGVGTAVGDYNKDGWLDIYVTSLGPAVAPPVPGRHLLYRNNGNGSFTDVAAAAGVATTSTQLADGFGAVFGDYDLDGDLDLFAAAWILNTGGNRLFRNNGGSFTDVTIAAGLGGLISCRGFSPRFVDMDGDRDPELLLAADFDTSHYLVNNGNGTFTDMTAASGTGLDANGMGHAVGDFDGNGLLDWYVTSIFATQSYLPGVPGTGNMLYLNVGGNVYLEISGPAGVKDGGWGWGTVAADFDQDGRVDLFETNGWSQPNGPNGPEWENERSYVFRNLGGFFTEVGLAAGVTETGDGRGLAGLDHDGDGDRDILIFGYDEPLRLYRNDIAGAGANFVRATLDTTSVSGLSPDGFGAKVKATIAAATQVRSVDGGSNYLVQDELAAHFGIGSAAAVDLLRVDWPNGAVSVRSGVPAGTMLTIHPCDLDGDESVGITDFLTLLQAWGPCPGPPQPCTADFDADGAVAINDFLTLLTAWGWNR